MSLRLRGGECAKKASSGAKRLGSELPDRYPHSGGEVVEVAIGVDASKDVMRGHSQ